MILIWYALVRLICLYNSEGILPCLSVKLQLLIGVRIDLEGLEIASKLLSVDPSEDYVTSVMLVLLQFEFG